MQDTTDPVMAVLANAMARYAIPTGEVERLIDGVAMDLETARYATWSDLRELTGDLPVEPVLGADLPQRQPHPVPVAQVVPSVPRPRQGGRDRPLGRLLPVIFVWIMIAAAAGSPDTAAALSVVFICLLACRVGYGGR